MESIYKDELRSLYDDVILAVADFFDVWLVWFLGFNVISNFVGYLMPKLSS